MEKNKPARRPSRSLRYLADAACIALSDTMVLIASLYVGKLLLYWIFDVPVVSIRYSILIVPTWWVLARMFRIIPGWGLGAVEELRRVELLLIAVFVLSAVAYFFGRERVLPSRVVYMGSLLFSAVFIPLGRAAIRKLLVCSGVWGCPVVIYGDVGKAVAVAEVLRQEPELGYKPVGIFTDSICPEANVDGLPFLGGLEDSTDQALIAVAALSGLPAARIPRLLDHTLVGYQRVILLPELNEDFFLWVYPRNFGGIIGLEVARNLLNPLARRLKRTAELTFVLLTAPVWIPVMMGVAVCIWIIDRETPFYMQARIGENGRIFHALKFRTMVPGAEKLLAELLASDAVLLAEWETKYKLKEDPRITKLGRILRRTSLDELPQLINVLKGDMSLVGPRPLPLYHHEALSPDARAPRNRVPPGLTGLWQVSGRSESGTSGMEKWDTYYVRNWSVWLDIIILARTVASVLSSKGAY